MSSDRRGGSIKTWGDLMYGAGQGSTRGRGGSPKSWSDLVRGTGRGSTRGRGSFYAREEIPKRDYGSLLESLKLEDVEKPEKLPKIHDCQYVASYNWVESKTPAILVPGAPPLWKPVMTKQYKVDSGIYFRDPNAAHYSKHPTEPAMRAVLAMQEDFDPSVIDIVACGSTLGNILRFASQKGRAFNMDGELIGNTLFLIRKEVSPTEIIKDVHGYGHTFPEENTEWEKDVKGSVSHQRILRYKFGDLTCLVRFESDGYLLSQLTAEEHAQLKLETSEPTSTHDESLSTLLEAATVSQKAPTTTQGPQCLTVKINKGRKIPQKAVFDIKTRSNKYNAEIDMSEVLPRIWISQTPNFIVGYHRNGYFDDVRVQDVKDKIQDWETDNQEAIGRFYNVIQEILKFARGLGSNSGFDKMRRFEVCLRTETGPLEIRQHLPERLVFGSEDPYQSALPPDLEEMWVAAGVPGQGSGDEVDQYGEGFSHSSDYEDETSYRSSSWSDQWGGEEEDFVGDYTACDKDDCGYCGKCPY